MPTAAQRGVQTRAELMAAAVAVVAERGWGAVTTRMVAERAGLLPGLVHYHFTSVNDLLIDATLHAASEEAARVLDGLAGDSASAGIDRLIDAVSSYDVDEPADNPAIGVFSEMLLAATRYERLRSGLAEILGDYRSALREWLANQGGAIDPEATAAVMFAALDGLVLHRVIDPRVRSLAIGPALRRLAGLPTNRTDEGTGR
jgi:TetR/AcrR family transcriptional regulator, regulator of biofilm formation and stress response